MKWRLFIPFLFVCAFLSAQKTTVSGVVEDEASGEPIPFAKVFFKNTKTGTETDLDGRFFLSSYYASDSLVVRASGFESLTLGVVRDQAQELFLKLGPVAQITEEVTIRAPKEKPSTTLLKRVIKNKYINNKEKLNAYQYETYNKIQLDLNNLSDEFKDRKIVQNLKVVMDYMDTMDGENILPVILSESLSDYYYRTHPTKKKEVIKASRITGVDNLKLNRFLGDMYQDINVYENYIGVFDKSFVSPISNFALGFYKFHLTDSMFIDNNWCYLLEFEPKRKGDLTFNGEMWINDTTYAVKKWSATVSKSANINYVNGLYLEQKFDQIQPEVWMLTSDRLIADLKIYRKSKLVGFYGRKLSTRENFVINQPHPPSFYNTRDVVEVLDSADKRDEAYWRKHRHNPLNIQEKGIDVMIDSLNETPLFNFFKNLTHMATTGFYPLGKIEVGSIRSLISYNKVEGLRNQIKLRTSNDFSRRVELRGRLAYGYKDQKFKYGGGVRFNVTPKKRGMLDVYYDLDVKQLGLGDEAGDIDAAFGSLLRTKPLTQLTLIEKLGAKFEKDLGKSVIITASGQWKELTALGETQFRIPTSSVSFNHIEGFRTFETSLKIRYGKNEEFISGAFDRISVGSKYPILTLEGILGIKGVFGSGYEYQKVGLTLEHSPRLGILGIMYYSVYGGIYFGSAPYPLLNIHPGSQSYWLQSSAHNLMDYYEFISDRYVGATLEHHFNGLFFNLIPGVRKLKWRIVVTGKSTWGRISDRQKEVMLLPDNTKQFGDVPYVESAIGIENIFKFFRVDLVWRMTHLEGDRSPLGVRAKFSIRF